MFVTRATLCKGNKILLFAGDGHLFEINLLSHDFLRISEHLDIVSKSLKIWIQYPNL